MSEKIIKLVNITKYYGVKTIIKAFSYTFVSGNVYVIKGENGAGKSTLLKIIARLIPYQEGHMINNLSISYLPEQPELIRHLKTHVYLKMLASLYYQFAFDSKKALKEWEIPARRISKCSKGNRQKVAILALFLANSDVILLDEPTDALDSASIKRLNDLINKAKRDNKIIILITHSPDHFEGVEYETIYLQQKSPQKAI